MSQAVELLDPLKYPAEQFKHSADAFILENVPGRQSEQAGDPLVEALPAAHDVQKVWPVFSCLKPALHSLHSVGYSKIGSGHDQFALVVALPDLLKIFCRSIAHNSGFTFPPPTENLPGSHAVQTADCGKEYFPGAQKLQMVEASEENCPPGHEKHIDAALVLLKLPDWQGIQDVAPRRG